MHHLPDVNYLCVCVCVCVCVCACMREFERGEIELYMYSVCVQLYKPNQQAVKVAHIIEE